MSQPSDRPVIQSGALVFCGRPHVPLANSEFKCNIRWVSPFAKLLGRRPKTDGSIPSGRSMTWHLGRILSYRTLVQTRLCGLNESACLVSDVDKVYPVDGGMEDWSYAAGFENSPRPITVCQPTTYGGYPQDCGAFHGI